MTMTDWLFQKLLLYVLCLPHNKNCVSTFKLGMSKHIKWAMAIIIIIILRLH